ncbi:ArsR/SmtB family transcription factor [Marinobacter sp. C2H3]|uniref:ArsR/SmtB family transcription factor n=1 Tax=Marinobacter sp. C2H3 TaxID=3119003 RepID=UPI00300E939E
MDTSDALSSFAALSQDTRLQAFRLLVRAEPDGLPAGDIARQLGVPHNTLSAHLAVLARAGWVTSQRHSRTIVYRASLAHVNATVQFLVQDCCGGHPDVCTPTQSTGACPP